VSALHDRRYSVELRQRGADGLWSPESKRTDLALAAVMRCHPSPGWSAAATRIADLRRGDHTRVELGDDAALILERI
jgi:hypothetical protein